MLHRWTCLLFLDVPVVLGMQVNAAAAPVMSKEILAVQVRKQGYICGKPVSAERDREHSRPNDAVWVLTCENATYRVRLVPKMAADVMIQ